MSKPAAAKTNAPPSGKLVTLSTLLLLEQDARQRLSKPELGFMMVNETHRLLPYRQCIFWHGGDTQNITIKAASGLSTIDTDSPYLIWLKRTIKNLPPSEETIQVITANDLDKDEHKDWSEWVSAHVAVIKLRKPEGQVLGGLWMDRDTPFTPAEIKLLEQLADAYAHAWDRLTREHLPWTEKLRALLRMKKSRLIVLGVMFAALLFPVRLSVNAPMEVVARDPFIVSAPLDGAIKDVAVRPNALVKKGDILFTMDDTALKNQVEISRKAFDIARATYSKVSREAFSDQGSKTELAVLKAESEAKKADLDYAQDLLKKTDILASRDGVAVFTDPNSLRGMPVQTGTRVMIIAEPSDTEILVRVPAKAMLLVNKEKPARIFLNVAPLSSIKATVTTVSYEATPDPDGLLTYKIKAALRDEDSKPRIGLKGTAKIYGGRSILIYQILRRPLVTLRSMLGV